MSSENCNTCISASTVGLSYIEEKCGCLGSEQLEPIKMRKIDASNRNINPSRETIESNDFRSDRNKGCTRSVETGSAGTLDFDWKICENNADLLDAALSSYPESGILLDGLPVAAVAPNQYVVNAGSISLCSGMLIEVAGFSNPENNGIKLICDITEDIDGNTIIEVFAFENNSSYPNLIDEVPTSPVTIAALESITKIGQDLRSFTIERGLSEDSYQVFRGVGVNGVSFSASPNNFITGSFDLLGFGDVDYCNEISLGMPEDVEDCCGSIFDDMEFFLGCEKLCGVTSFDFNLNNNMSQTKASCSNCLSLGTVDISGSISIFFTDCAQQQAVKDNAGQPLNIIVWNKDKTDFLNFYFPYVTFNSADIDPVQGEPLTQTIEWSASVGGDCSTSLFVQRSIAATPLVRNRFEIETSSDTLKIDSTATDAITRTYEWGDGSLPEVTAASINENLIHNYIAPYGAGILKKIAVHAPEDFSIIDITLDAQSISSISLCWLEQLETLDLSGNDLTSLDLRNLSSLTNVNLANNPNLSQVLISGAESITSLDISAADLVQSSVNIILENLASSGLANGFVDLSGGGSSAPGTSGAAAITQLVANGWTVITN